MNKKQTWLYFAFTWQKKVLQLLLWTFLLQYAFPCGQHGLISIWAGNVPSRLKSPPFPLVQVIGRVLGAVLFSIFCFVYADQTIDGKMRGLQSKLIPTPCRDSSLPSVLGPKTILPCVPLFSFQQCLALRAQGELTVFLSLRPWSCPCLNKIAMPAKLLHLAWWPKRASQKE